MHPLSVHQLPLRDAAKALSLSYHRAWSLANAGHLAVVVVGRRLYVPVAELERVAREGIITEATAASRRPERRRN
jgi:hypothetical protein